MQKVRVWDLPLRLFHWSLAILVVLAIITAQVGGNALVWHFRFGYSILALLMFRLVWGFAGTRYARFADFISGPRRILDYLKGRSVHTGHNPLGSLSVLAMLLLFITQAALGLFSNDDIFSEGPLVAFISKERSDWLTWLHTEVGALAVYFMIGLHIAAVLFYALVKRQQLVVPMLTGDRMVPGTLPSADDSLVKRLLALGIMLLCSLAVYFIVHLQP
jgi:cytochrome b